jgi:ATP-dependent RNA helicase DDX52/ROK1
VTFFTEEDAGQLRGIANVMRAAGCEVPDWMLTLKKERRHRKRKAPEPGAISTEPKAERKQRGPRQDGKGGKQQRGKQEREGGKQLQQHGGKSEQRQPKKKEKATKQAKQGKISE